MHTTAEDRSIRAQVLVNADVDSVWNTWTTHDGIVSFFAPACNVELQVNGAYEIFFDPDGEPGMRGSEGMRVLAFQRQSMLAFTWNAPPHLPNVRAQQTHVVVRFRPEANDRTRVTLFHDGWGTGEEWDKAFAYLDRAWKQTVLPRLVYRFAIAPVDWNDPPSVHP